MDTGCWRGTWKAQAWIRGGIKVNLRHGLGGGGLD